MMRPVPERPVVIGAGPAGSMAAIVLAQAGAAPVLVDRDTAVGDALCGGFLSWRTAARLKAVGIDPAALGAHPVDRVALFAAGREAVLALPGGAWGLSRHALDTAMRARAITAGAAFEVDRIRRLEGNAAQGERRTWRGPALFLATGKHDLRGAGRPRTARDPVLGLRLRLPSEARRTALIGGRIELHLFDGGYAGIVLQEDGSANLCLAIHKSRLGAAGGTPVRLLEALAERHSAFAARLPARIDGPVEGIGAVPYGWIAQAAGAGVFRIGDQAAVIPSLAGEGMGIAIASAASAARGYLAGGGAAAPAWQHRFARIARRPLRVAGGLWRAGETPALARFAVPILTHAPWLANAAMRGSRI